MCDEATSALDPQTTASVLSLLSKINRELGLTIVLITHEMDVIRRVCDRVAVLDAGQMVETGPVTRVFLHPQHPTTRRFVSESEHMDEGALHRDFDAVGGRIVRLTFLGGDTYEPLLGSVARQTGVDYNIPSGRIDRIKDTRMASWSSPWWAVTSPPRRPRSWPPACTLRNCVDDHRYCRRLLPPPDADKWVDIGKATLETLLMMAGSLPLTLAIGLPMGVLLYVFGAPQMKRRPLAYGALAIVVNLLRSVPFIILMVVLIPVSLWLMGQSIGVLGTLPALVIGAAPFYARLVETALREVDRGVVEAAQSMGATTATGHPGAASRGAAGPDCRRHGHYRCSGWLHCHGRRDRFRRPGDLALREGYQRNRTDVALVTVVVLLIPVQLLQMLGDRRSRTTPASSPPQIVPAAGRQRCAAPGVPELPASGRHYICARRSLNARWVLRNPACRPAPGAVAHA